MRIRTTRRVYDMVFEEPKMEFIPIEMEDVMRASGGGAAIDICAPGSSNDEPDFPCFNGADGNG